MAKKYELKIKRQTDLESNSFWENFSLSLNPDQSLHDALLILQKEPYNSDGKGTQPVLWNPYQALLINGKPGFLQKSYARNFSQSIRIEPLSSFPVLRDLINDFSSWQKTAQDFELWNEVSDEYLAHEPQNEIQENSYFTETLQSCLYCGICSEVCPKINDRSSFKGILALAESQALQETPVGKIQSSRLLSRLQNKGGLSDCDLTGLCEKNCPQGIPLTEFVNRLNRKTLKTLFLGFSPSSRK